MWIKALIALAVAAFITAVVVSYNKSISTAERLKAENATLAANVLTAKQANDSLVAEMEESRAQAEALLAQVATAEEEKRAIANELAEVAGGVERAMDAPAALEWRAALVPVGVAAGVGALLDRVRPAASPAASDGS